MTDEISPPPAPPPGKHTGKQSEPTTEQTAPAVGDVVGYRHRDVITGAMLAGAGLVVAVGADGGLVTVAPVSSYFVDVDPANINAGRDVGADGTV